MIIVFDPSLKKKLIFVVALVLPLPNPNDPRQHEACCPLCKQSVLIENIFSNIRYNLIERKCRKYKFLN